MNIFFPLRLLRVLKGKRKKNSAIKYNKTNNKKYKALKIWLNTKKYNNETTN